MKILLAGAAVAALMYSPALAADYYIVQDPTTRRCTVVEQRPANPGVGVVLGPLSFGVRGDAESHMRTVETCRETTGRGGGSSGGDTVIIDKR
jgi:hypothetical protein